MKISTKAIILLAFIAALLNVENASSQLRFGLKGGFDVSSNRINKDILNTSNRLGFQIGGTMELMAPIVGWGGELSVLYGHQKGDDGRTDAGAEYKVEDYNYLRVPLNLKKKFSIVGLFGVFIQAGPYAEFKLSGADVERKGGIDDQWEAKSFAAGINAGAGVEVLNHLELGMYYRKSLTDNYGDKAGWENVIKKRPDNWSVNLTYFF